MRTLRRLCALGLLLAVSCVPALALSQEDQPDRAPEARPAGSGIEEIVISRPQGGTASVQDVSISVSAFAAETLERQALSNVADIGNLAPNVDIDKTSPFSGSSSVLSPFIRGIGQNDFAFNLEPGVGVYVDGVYFARTIGAVVDLLDLDRVEILKGPQGTVFGRNTIGGALNIITRRPSDSFDYRGDVTIGRFDRIDVRGAIDVPIRSETLVSQFSFSSKRRDGYQKRVSFPGGPFNSDEELFSRARYATPGKSGGEHQDNFRGKFVWTASDTLELTFAGDYSTVDEEGIPGSLVNSNAGPGAMTVAGLYNACISTPPAALAMWGLAAVCGPRGLAPTRSNPTAGSNPLPGLAGVNVDGDPSNDRPVFGNQFISSKDVSFGTGSNFSKIDASGLSVTANMDIGEGLALKSISAFRRLSADFGTDLDGSPIDIGDTSFSTNQRQYSQELQLVGSSFEKRLDWLLGAYYFHEKGDLTDFVPFGEGLVQVDGENLFTNIAYAAFTNLTYSVTDAFSVSLGVRFTDEHKDFAGRGARATHGLGLVAGVEEALAAARVQHRAAVREDVADVARAKRPVGAIDQPVVAVLHADYLAAVLQAGAHDGANRRVHAGRIAAGGEYADRFVSHGIRGDSVNVAAPRVQRPLARGSVHEPRGVRPVLQHGLEHRDVRELHHGSAVAADAALHPGLEREPLGPADRLVAAARAARGERNAFVRLLVHCWKPPKCPSASYPTRAPGVCRWPLDRGSKSNYNRGKPVADPLRQHGMRADCAGHLQALRCKPWTSIPSACCRGRNSTDCLSKRSSLISTWSCSRRAVAAA